VWHLLGTGNLFSYCELYYLANPSVMLEQLEDNVTFIFGTVHFLLFYFSVSETGSFQWAQLSSSHSFLTPVDKQTFCLGKQNTVDNVQNNSHIYFNRLLSEVICDLKESFILLR
jgi:hypothetical protein